MSEPKPDVAGVIVFPPLLMAGAMISGALFEWLLPARVLPRAVAWGAGIVLMVLSALLARSAKAAMRRVGTEVRPDRPTTALALDWPYTKSRNPLYIAGLGVILAVACMVNSLWSFLFIIPFTLVLHFGVVLREERYLSAKFGEPYRQYMARVRRWL